MRSIRTCNNRRKKKLHFRLRTDILVDVHEPPIKRDDFGGIFDHIPPFQPGQIAPVVVTGLHSNSSDGFRFEAMRAMMATEATRAPVLLPWGKMDPEEAEKLFGPNAEAIRVPLEISVEEAMALLNRRPESSRQT